MHITEIRCVRDGQEMETYVLMSEGDVCIKIVNIGFDAPQISQIGWDQAGDDITARYGAGWERLDVTSTPADLGDAPTGELPDPLA